MRAMAVDMRRMYRGHMYCTWMLRGSVFFNVSVVAYDWASGSWLACLFTPLNAWAGWKAFRVSEDFAVDLPRMRYWLWLTEQRIKQAERIIDESRT